MNKSGFLNLFRGLVEGSDLEALEKEALLNILTAEKFSLITPDQIEELVKLVDKAVDEKEAGIVMGNDPEEIEDYTEAKSKIYEFINGSDLAFLGEQGVTSGGGVNLLDFYAGLEE